MNNDETTTSDLLISWSEYVIWCGESTNPTLEHFAVWVLANTERRAYQKMIASGMTNLDFWRPRTERVVCTNNFG
jgi:hypothetical protein